AVDEEAAALLMAAGLGRPLAGSVALGGRVGGAGVRAYGIGGGRALAGACAAELPGPALPEWVAPLGLIVPGHILVENLARRLGIDPDVPRGLNKVTQTH